MVVHTRLEAKIIYEYGERCKSESRVSVTVTTQVCEGGGALNFCVQFVALILCQLFNDLGLGKS